MRLKWMLFFESVFLSFTLFFVFSLSCSSLLLSQLSFSHASLLF